MAIEHVNITEADLHETKGASTANAGEVLVAAGGGADAVWKTAWCNGMEFYSDLATIASPVPLTLAATNYKIPMDGLGSGQDLGEAFPGSTPLWNVSTQQFEFNTAGASIGDSVDIECDINVTSNGANNDFIMSMDIGTGSATAFNHPILVLSIKSAATVRMTGYFSLSLHNTDQLNYPATFQLQSDSTGDTFTVNHFVVRHVFQKVRYV
jgi:hypothetical protein